MSAPGLHAGGARAIGFLAGLGYALRGARFVYVQHPRLARLWLPPVVFTFAALIATTWYALDLRDDIAGWLWTAPTGEGVTAVAARGLHVVLEWVAALLLIAVGVIAVALLSSVVAAPFNDALSEAVECTYTGSAPPPLSLRKLLVDAVRAIGLQLMKLAAYCAVMGPAFVLSLALPGVGSAIYAVLGFLVTAMFLAIDYVDYAAARRGLGVRERVRAALGGWRSMLGLGTAIWALLFVPLLNVLFMPAAVAGGTLLFVDSQRPPDAVSTGKKK